MRQLLGRLTQGDATQTSFVIIEGTTFADVKRALRDGGQVKNTVLDLPDGELMSRLGAPGKGAEGRFFPDTYFFSAGSSDLNLLRRAHDAMNARLAAAWEKRADGLPLATPDEALILASIVEKETGRPVDRPLIASVFINRLKRGMRLQTDPTVIYGMGDKFDGNLRRRDLETDTPGIPTRATDCRRRRSRCLRRHRWTPCCTRRRRNSSISSREATGPPSFRRI